MRYEREEREEEREGGRERERQGAREREREIYTVCLLSKVSSRPIKTTVVGSLERVFMWDTTERICFQRHLEC